MNASQKEGLFTQWIAEHRGIVVKVARSFTSTSADADDLMQEILIRLWASTDRYRGDAKPSTWIYQVALNRALTWQRDTSRRRTESSIDELRSIATSTSVDDAHALNRLYEQIRELSKVDRSLMLMSLDGFSYAEMADITGITEANVGARLTRARKKLFAMIDEANQ